MSSITPDAPKRSLLPSASPAPPEVQEIKKTCIHCNKIYIVAIDTIKKLGIEIYFCNTACKKLYIENIRSRNSDSLNER